MQWGRRKHTSKPERPEWTKGLPNPETYEDLATGAGCITTERICRDGARVGYMIRSADRADPVDTGWQFFAGDESPDYLDDASNAHVFAVNTIANHDRAIIPYLDAPDDTAWIRVDDEFVLDPDGVPERD